MERREPSRRKQRKDLREWEDELLVSVSAEDKYGRVEYTASEPDERLRFGKLLSAFFYRLDSRRHGPEDRIVFRDASAKKPETPPYLADPPAVEEDDGLSPA